MVFLRVIVRGVVVRVGADRDKHFAAIAREREIASPVSAASQAAAGRNIRNDRLRRTARFQIAVAVGKPHYRTGVPNVDKLRVWAGRVEGYAEGLRQSRGEYFHDLRLAVLADAT